jgi:tetratricopeptide (TPR) repeat protein
MHAVRKIAVVTVVLLFLTTFLWARRPSAQEYERDGSGQAFEEEELSPDSQTVTPDDGPGDEEAVDEGEDDPSAEFEGEEDPSYHGSRDSQPVPLESDSASLPSDSETAQGIESSEEPPLVTSGPPALPSANALPPREQVAVHFVAAGVEAIDKEDFARARTLFERAIEIAPLQPYSYYFLGKLALTQGEHQRAVPLLRKADVLLMRGDQAWRSETISTLGAVYEDLGELPQARRAYRKSLQLFPQNLRAMSALARLAEEEPDPDDTISQ